MSRARGNAAGRPSSGCSPSPAPRSLLPPTRRAGTARLTRRCACAVRGRVRGRGAAACRHVVLPGARQNRDGRPRRLRGRGPCGGLHAVRRARSAHDRLGRAGHQARAVDDSCRRSGRPAGHVVRTTPPFGRRARLLVAVAARPCSSDRRRTGCQRRGLRSEGRRLPLRAGLRRDGLVSCAGHWRWW